MPAASMEQQLIAVTEGSLMGSPTVGIPCWKMRQRILFRAVKGGDRLHYPDAPQTQPYLEQYLWHLTVSPTNSVRMVGVVCCYLNSKLGLKSGGWLCRHLRW